MVVRASELVAAGQKKTNVRWGLGTITIARQGKDSTAAYEPYVQ